MRLFFVLGREPALSATEIYTVLRQRFEISDSATVSREIMQIEAPESFDPASLMRVLGGTIKIGIIQETLNRSATMEEIIVQIEKLVRETPRLKNLKRIHFGISVYDGEPEGLPEKILRDFRKAIPGIKIKHNLKEAGFAVRWVTSKEPTLSSVVVDTNRLLTDGVEIVLVMDRNKIFIGQTVAVQLFRELERRDFGRPGRDARSGMLPPKLAGMMVNLAGAPLTATLLDPFCGSGTLLGEAWLLGYRTLIASDIDSTALARTTENLTWLDAKSTGKVRLIDSGIKKLPETLAPASVDAIITEPFLGPPLTGRERPDEVEHIERDLRPLFHDMLRAFKMLLKPNGVAVVAFPLWCLSLRGGRGPTRQSHEFIHASILSELKNFGFYAREPLPAKLMSQNLAPELGLAGRSLIYGRPDQHVWREIVILQKI